MESDPHYATVRLNCFRYFAGVMPVSWLKSRVKWLCDENPRSRATPERELVFALSVSSALLTRRRLMKRCKLKPVDCLTFLAKWLGESPTIKGANAVVGTVGPEVLRITGVTRRNTAS